MAAHGIVVDGEVQLEGLSATGGALRFRSATLGSGLVAARACLNSPEGYTLNLHQAVVRGSVLLVDGFESHGLVKLNRSTIEGRLDCTDGVFTSPGGSPGNKRGHAIEAISATVRGGMYLGWRSVTPSVDLSNAATTILADDPGNWPSQFVVSGLTYDRYEQSRHPGTGQVWDWQRRRNWLRGQQIYDSGPYEHAARVFRQHGYSRDAERLLIAQRTDARRTGPARQSAPSRALDRAYGLSVGYGYRPWRVLYLLAVLLTMVAASLWAPTTQATLRATGAGGTVYTTQGPIGSTPSLTSAGQAVSSPDACGDGRVRCFNPFFYAVDTVIPLVSLDQRAVWYPDPHAHPPWGRIMEWWLHIATLIGWTLSSIFVLSFARLARSP